jgi:membrane-bound lytic murein transglycosylase A
MIPSSSDPESESVLFTGYYQPIIAASLTETEEFRFPLYAVPADLTAPKAEMERVDGETNASYFSRREIDQAGALRGRGLEIAWVKDPIDIFFLQIQGSGILQLDDGRKLQIGYAAQNGRPYRSIGRLLIEQGMVASEEMSMQRLRRYLTERPQERDEIFFHNESYVFFRLLNVGPLGSLEVPLTPGRSLATDARLFPKAALAFIVTETPVIDSSGELSGWQPLSRFVLNQDTGGAIRGLQRGDELLGRNIAGQRRVNAAAQRVRRSCGGHAIAK